MATQLLIDWRGDFSTNTYTLATPEIPNAHEVERTSSAVVIEAVEAYDNMRVLARPETAYHDAGLMLPSGAQLDHTGGSMLMFLDPRDLVSGADFLRVFEEESGFPLRVFRTSDELWISLNYDIGDPPRIEVPWPTTGSWLWLRLEPNNATNNQRLQYKLWEYGDPIPENFTVANAGSGGDPADGTNFDPFYSILFLRRDSSEAAGALGPIVIDDDPDADLSGFVTGEAGPAVPVITETTPLSSTKPLTITGTDFSASGNTVILSPTTDHEHADAETQTIDAESSTEITTDPITLPDGIGAGDGLYLFVVDDDDNVSDPYPMLVSDPALRLDAVGDPESNLIVDAAGDPVTGSVNAVVMSGAAGSRSIVYDGASVSVTAGVMEIVDVAFSIDELGDPYTVMLVAGSNVACVCTASVVDRNEDE